MLEPLKHFVLIAEHGTFTEAARRAHVTQPALSASIRRLEEELGGSLFDRGRHGATLSAAGEALMPHALAALAAVKDARRAVEQIEGLTAGRVRIGAGATACTYLLPKPFAAFRRRHPDIRFLLRETTTDEALDGLSEGSLDLAVLSAAVPGDLQTESLQRSYEPMTTELWMKDRLILVRAPSLDPKGAAYLTFRPGATTRALFEQHFPDADVSMELGSIAAVKGNVRAGMGIALVSQSAVRDDLKRKRLVRVRDPRTPIVRELRLAHRGLDRLSPAARALRDQLLG